MAAITMVIVMVTITDIGYKGSHDPGATECTAKRRIRVTSTIRATRTNHSGLACKHHAIVKVTLASS